MGQTLREKIAALFTKSELPVLTEHSSLKDISDVYPNFYDFIQRKFGIKISPEEKLDSLRTLVKRHQLPPPQIVFMEVQMNGLAKGVQEITPLEAQTLVQKNSDVSILDVRENWELNMGAIPQSVPLTAELLDDILQNWDKDRPLLLYCHFGIRSLDAASFLADRGFKNIYLLKGGIDGWASDIDPSLPRYEGAYC